MVRRMKSAKEMFEELGYRRFIDTKKADYVYPSKEMYVYITFTNRTYFSYLIDLNDGGIYIPEFSMSALKAIYKQCEELGWI